MELKQIMESVPPVFSLKQEVKEEVTKAVRDFFDKVREIRIKDISYNDKQKEIVSLITSIDKNGATVLLSKRYKDIEENLIVNLDEIFEKGIIEEKDSLGMMNTIIVKNKDIMKHNFLLNS